MTRPDIDAIKKRAQEASPAPWALNVGTGEILSVTPGENKLIVLMRPSCVNDQWEADGLFIYSAREDIPALLAYIEALEKVVEAATDMDNNFNGQRWASIDDTDKLRWEGLRKALSDLAAED